MIAIGTAAAQSSSFSRRPFIRHTCSLNLMDQADVCFVALSFAARTMHVCLPVKDRRWWSTRYAFDWLGCSRGAAIRCLTCQGSAGDSASPGVFLVLEASAACVVKLSGTQTSFFMSIRRKISRRHRPDTYAAVQALVWSVAHAAIACRYPGRRCLG
jgi:hypothetical protein